MIELVYNDRGGRRAIALITLKRPPANAFTPEGLLQLKDTIEYLNTQTGRQR